jgi:O-antigen ligase
VSRTTENTWWDKWIAFLIPLIALLIPLEKKAVPLTIIILGIVLVIRSIKTKEFFLSKRDFPIYLLSGIFVLHIIGITYSENVDYAWTEVGIKFSFLGFPLLALMLPRLSKEKLIDIDAYFILGCLLYLVISVVSGVYDSIQLNDFTYLSYALLSEPYHPTYAATYQAIAIFLLLYKTDWPRFSLGKGTIFFVVLCIMVVFVSMLASKAGLLALWICLTMIGVYYAKQGRHWKYTLGAPGLLLALSIATMQSLPGTSNRIEKAVTDVRGKSTTQQSIEEQNDSIAHAQTSTSLRMVTWTSSLELLLNNPFGVGTGDTTNELEKIYERKGEELAHEKSLNAHNQFLQTGAELGWPALILFIAMLILLFFQSIRTKDLFLLTFLLVCGMNFLFESFLEVQAGIVFFCFWVLIFLRKD